MKKNKKYSALLLLRKNDLFCKKFSKFISPLSKFKKILWTERNKKYSLTKLKNKKFDFIISYRSSMILKNQDISIANIAAINLHPGPPKYRGIGCLNYALYNNEKKYGFTIHLINKKIDAGKILFVKYFPIKKKSSVKELLNKTHNNCVKKSKHFFRDIFNDADRINFYRKKFAYEKWSNTIKNKNGLEKFYRISNLNIKEVYRKIRATNYLQYKPYIQFGREKFYLK